MIVLGFLAFLVVSHLVVMQIFRLTTYHAYFWKAMPLLVGYSVLVGWLLFTFDFHRFFVYQVVLASLWLFIVARKQAKTGDALTQQSGEDVESVRSVARSVSKTRQYYAYGSFVYVVVFSVTYLWLYNTGSPFPQARGLPDAYGAAIIVVLVVVASLFFGITGFKTRCPNCGVFKLHPKDRERNAKMVQSYNDTVSVGLTDEYSKPGYVNDWLRCVKCDKQYQRHTANEWMNISREFGNDDAILEYKKLQEEIADRKRRRAEAQRSA